MEILAFILRLTHIVCGAALIGGFIFQRFGLADATQELSEETRKSFGMAWRRIWSKIVMASSGLLLLSGFVNFWLVMKTFSAAEVEMPSWYHATFGIKFLIALGIFFVASLLSGKREKSDRLRENPKFLLNVGLVLCLLIVGLSGLLRSSHTSPNPTDSDGESQTARVEVSSKK